MDITDPTTLDGEPQEVSEAAALELEKAAAEVEELAAGTYRLMRNAALDQLGPTPEAVARWETSTQGRLAKLAVERATQLSRAATVLQGRADDKLAAL